MPIYPVYSDASNFTPNIMFYHKAGDWLYGEDLKSSKAVICRLFQTEQSGLLRPKAIGLFITDFKFDDLNAYYSHQHIFDRHKQWRAARVKKFEYKTFEDYVHFW